MYASKKFLMIFVVIFSVLSPSLAYASSSMILVLIPGLTLEDINSSRNLSYLAASGGTGLMNTGSANKRLSSAYLSISAGKRAAAPVGGILAFQVSESHGKQLGGEIYKSFTGHDYQDSQIVFPYIHQFKIINSPDITPGLLGKTLSRANIPVFLLGNQDLPNSPSRPGVLIGMDGEGKLSNGYIDQSVNQVSSFSPTYLTTNYDFIITKVNNFLENTQGLVIIDFGDLARLDSFTQDISWEHYLSVRKKLLGDIDEAVGKISTISQVNNKSILIISPYPAKSRLDEGLTLTPAILFSKETVPGLLISQSTKRTGIITNLDIGPTIISYMGITEKEGFGGKPLRVVPDTDSISKLNKMDSVFAANYAQRPYILKTYVMLQIISVLGIIILLLLKHRFLQYMRLMLLALQACPLLLILLPLLPSLNIFWRITALLTFLIILTFLLEFLLQPLERLAVLFIFTALCLIGDLYLGAPLMKVSILGYDPISGARYYGIGNEYLGVLLGSSLIGLTLTMEIVRKKYFNHKYFILAFFLVFLGISYIAAAPQWGTNVGGGISFFFSFIILLLLINQKRLGLKTVSSALVFTLFALGILFIYDLNRPLEAQTHIGLTAQLVREGGLASILPIIRRKLSMNWKLFHYSLWSRVLVTFLASLALFFYRPIGLFSSVFHNLPYLHSGLITGIIGTFIILFVNDSGIVAAATTMIYVAPTLLYLLSLNIHSK